MTKPENIHVHVYLGESNPQILETLQSLERKVDKLMSLADDLKGSIQKIADATTKVSNRMDELIQKLKDESLSTEQKTEVLGDLQELADHLDAMGTDPVDPVPEPPAALTKK